MGGSEKKMETTLWDLGLRTSGMKTKMEKTTTKLFGVRNRFYFYRDSFLHSLLSCPMGLQTAMASCCC